MFPIALVVLAGFALIGASFGFGTGLIVWSARVSAVIGIASSAGVSSRRSRSC
ncbi:MAG TPA: hypothetical protein VKH36_05100 [Acidimicrobiia bacterium]|nr:hypothetical protein [Acidimicrobiia bacterium]